MLINAAEHYQPGKRQNSLFPEHIDKIVYTYKHRKEEDRYARRVSMEEIEENGYNLNITRYISMTFPGNPGHRFMRRISRFRSFPGSCTRSRNEAAFCYRTFLYA